MSTTAPDVLRRTYVDTSWGQLHAVTAGDSGPWIGLLHESPLSSEVWLDVVRALAGRARVVAFDTPGYGASSPPPREGFELGDYAAVIAEACTALGMEAPVFAGVHTGAALAVELCHLVPDTAGIVLSGISLFSPEQRDEFIAGWTPPVPTDLDGAQFDWAVERYTRIWPELTPELLHVAAMQLLRVKDRYHWGYQAAFRHDPRELLRTAACPVLLLDAEHDMLAFADAEAMELAQDGRLEILPGLPGQPHLRVPETYADHLVAFALECASTKETI
ncbi:alpha/beta fold hydrolase [Aeromicrobium sp. Leaf350]|uniref:alpha/beta fold hydrolase n=1 Tax=Aeromicrobium sp. Leaf350 TaxID=2876565 RepID=UPI001E5FAED7|nr:alpha/beta hydrolase [Aeromicrobium sp. Leaf350]